jgi:hypothetical protein
MAEFSTWYHGTLREKAIMIRRGGLKARAYGTDFQGLGVPYHVLAKERHEATGWANEGTGAIVTFRVPDDQASEYLTCLNEVCVLCLGTLAGLLKPLPARMVHSVENI